MDALKETNFKFLGQTGFYRGKVRDVYYFGEKLAIVATDRISAFDVVLPRAIPYKGQVLNQIAAYHLKATSDIVPNWVTGQPDVNVTIGRACEPFKVEMVIRGYLAGHAWREYQKGKRKICGHQLPEGFSENDKLPAPIITPTTKADKGHDKDISAKKIVKDGIVSAEDYAALESYTHELYNRGTELAAKQGLILVDTKYEFGKADGRIYLIDEIHTPDSSRYFYMDGFAERQERKEPQKQLSKEFVRKWLIENNFQGKKGQKIPEMTDQKVNEISERYLDLYEMVTGQKFFKTNYDGILFRIEKSITENIF